MSIRWHIAYTNPRQEVRVQRDLESRGYLVFLPMLTRQRVSHRMVVGDVQVPLFPRYLFAGLAEDQHTDGMYGVHGIVRLLRKPTGEPIVVSPKVVSDLQFAEIAGMFDLRPRAVVYRPGQRVKVVAGPLADRMAQIVAAPPTGRIRVLMELFGGRITAEVDAGQIRPMVEDRA